MYFEHFLWLPFQLKKNRLLQHEHTWTGISPIILVHCHHVQVHHHPIMMVVKQGNLLTWEGNVSDKEMSLTRKCLWQAVRWQTRWRALLGGLAWMTWAATLNGWMGCPGMASMAWIIHDGYRGWVSELAWMRLQLCLSNENGWYYSWDEWSGNCDVTSCVRVIQSWCHIDGMDE